MGSFFKELGKYFDSLFHCDNCGEKVEYEINEKLNIRLVEVCRHCGHNLVEEDEGREDGL